MVGPRSAAPGAGLLRIGGHRPVGHPDHRRSPAFVNEDVRQRLAQVKTLEQAVSEVFRDAAPGIAANLPPPILDTTATARGFHNICDDLVPGGADAYTVYRVLSQYSHATIRVVDGYLQATSTGPGVVLRTNPAEPDAATWTNVLASCLVWAGRSNDYIDGAKTRRSELRAAANALGINSELQLSPAAVLRESRRPSQEEAGSRLPLESPFRDLPLLVAVQQVAHDGPDAPITTVPEVRPG